MPGQHTKPVYVTCTWCARAYLGMPELTPWSEVFGREDSGAETEEIVGQSSQETYSTSSSSSSSSSAKTSSSLSSSPSPPGPPNCCRQSGRRWSSCLLAGPRAGPQADHWPLPRA
eukprot:5563-Rhodomonas_salina.1